MSQFFKIQTLTSIPGDARCGYPNQVSQINWHASGGLIVPVGTRGTGVWEMCCNAPSASHPLKCKGT